MSRFYTILTRIGIAKILNATITDQQVDITHMAIGDVAHTPNQDATSLPSEVWRGPVHLVEIDETNPNWLNIEAAIPSTVGGFTARSLALYDSAGDVLAVGILPESYKPIMAEGSSKDLYVRSIIEVSNASVVNIKADPSAIIANRKYVDDKIQIITSKLINISEKVKDIDDKVTEHLVDDALVKHKAKQISVVNPESEETEDLQAFAEQLFTDVSSGKNLIGTAITDVDNTKVVPINPTFTQLANLVRGISTGMRQATGRVSMNNGAIVVAGLEFRPRLIVTYWDGSSPNTRFGVYSVAQLVPSNFTLNISQVGATPDVGAFSVNNTGFTARFTGAVDSIAMSWIAFG